MDVLQTAKPYDTLLVLENLTFLAYNAENDGDVSRTLELFRILKPLAEQTGFLGELLRNFGMFFSDHPELGEEGLDILRQLQAFYQDGDQEIWVFASMDMADYLGLMRRWDEIAAWELKELAAKHNIELDACIWEARLRTSKAGRVEK
ncbi:MAG: hypothetical protein M8353_03125 [ANME-2 cluster archaeon]|nr:hypothetical protein [ANME-2 cluster archaeon]